MANIFDLGSSDDSNVDIGGLLGGPRDSIIEPIVGQQALHDARQNALLNFGAAMLRNSGPSRMPVTFASALGGAVQDAQQAYQGTLDNSLKSSQQAAQLRMAQLGYDRQRMLMQIAGSLARGQVGSPGAQQPMSGGFGGGGAGVAGNSAPGMAAAGGFGAGSVGAGGGGAGMTPVGATQAAQSGGSAPGMSGGLLNALTLLDPEHQAAYQNIYERQNPMSIVAPDGTVINPRDQANVGTQHGKLPDGMIRNPDGSIGWAPGYLPAQGQSDLQHQIIGMTGDTVPVVDNNPKSPTFGQTQQIPKLQALGLGMGANGQLQLNLGGNGYTSAVSPAQAAEAKGDVDQFLKQRQAAVDSAAAATASLRMYQQLNDLLPQISSGAGSAGQVEVMNVLDKAGLLGPAGSDKLAAMRNFQQTLNQAALSSVKSIFPQRVSNYETQSVLKTFSNIDDPKKAIQFRLDSLQAAQQAMQERANFFQNYDGPRGKAEQEYEQSAAGKKSLGDYPQMWRNFPIDQPKAGSAAAQAGVVRVHIPGGRTVFAVPDGNGGYAPYQGQ